MDDPLSVLWGVVGGIVYQLGWFVIAALATASGMEQHGWAGSWVAQVVWGVVCCVQVGRLVARDTVRHRAALIVVNALGFAIAAVAPPTADWYSVRWVERVVTASTVPLVLITVGFVTRRRPWRVERPAHGT